VKIIGCTWPEGVAQHIRQKHNIDLDEVDEVFTSHPHVRSIEESHRAGEKVYAALGQTEAGRYLIVFFTHTQDEQARILGARDMRRAERRKYEQT
jgi:uncharacterized DUF497 family protein